MRQHLQRNLRDISESRSFRSQRYARSPERPETANTKEMPCNGSTSNGTTCLWKFSVNLPDMSASNTTNPSLETYRQ